MLARRLTTIVPAMTLAEALETTRLHRVAGLTGARPAVVTTSPCRAPPHTEAGLSGGGQVPTPGEGSRAHPDLLWLAERPERSAMSSRSGDPRSGRASSKEHCAPITDIVARAALAARSQATTHAHTSRCMELLTAHRAAARTTPLLTACPWVTIIAFVRWWCRACPRSCSVHAKGGWRCRPQVRSRPKTSRCSHACLRDPVAASGPNS